MAGSILIIEDEPLIQMLLESICEEAEVQIVGMVDSVVDAISAVEKGNFDSVILDINLQGESSEPVAEILQHMKVPVVVSTGTFEKNLPAAFSNFRVVHKPFSTNFMIDLIQSISTK